MNVRVCVSKICTHVQIPWTIWMSYSQINFDTLNLKKY